ncbi:hypothetical protein NT2_09_00100 [Caenibius tardaugens NBRC 16725]|uniref:SnoaL-like domain-containing protein n=1 Tax=Caenibius tardaugens NBRC 16725 TaxID=1219035 RepID=U2YP56_9SPHN|nr:nuclear transport factor 2 family protein [Caenibius tardaugens]GAD50402.1 hypothetical protein NT2_09_00100 [Caenibius tardaugens NBRC 16725]
MKPAQPRFQKTRAYTPESVAKRQEVIDVAIRYSSSLENFDLERYVTCFTDNPQFLIRDPEENDWRNYASPEVANTPGASLAVGVAQARFTLGRIDSIHWILSNFEVDIDGDKAWMRCNFTCTHRMDDHPSGAFCVLGGYYEDDLVRVDGEWRIAIRRTDIRWRTGDIAIVRGGGNRYSEEIMTTTEIQ